MINKTSLVSAGLILCGLFLSSSVAAHRVHHLHAHGDSGAFIGKELLLNAKGNAVAYQCAIPETKLGTTTALCFDVPLFNIKMYI